MTIKTLRTKYRVLGPAQFAFGASVEDGPQGPLAE
jgi:hypothetical protein